MRFECWTFIIIIYENLVQSYVLKIIYFKKDYQPKLLKRGKLTEKLETFFCLARPFYCNQWRAGTGIHPPVFLQLF